MAVSAIGAHGQRVLSSDDTAHVMARTPHGSWPGSARFGLRDYLESSGPRAVAAKTALDEMNAALADLGISYRVESLTREPSEAGGSAAVAISLVSADGQSEVFRIASRD